MRVTPPIILLLLFSVLQAESENPPAHIAVKSGSAITGIAGSGSEFSTTRFGAVGGVSFGFPITDKISIQPELLWHPKGYTQLPFDYIDQENSRIVPVPELCFRNTYIELPILADFSWGEKRVRPHVFAGVVPAVLLKTEILTEPKTELFNMVKMIDIGAAAGGSAHISAGPGEITAEGRFTLGITSCSERQNWRNWSGTFMIGYSLPLKRSSL